MTENYKATVAFSLKKGEKKVGFHVDINFDAENREEADKKLQEATDHLKTKIPEGYEILAVNAFFYLGLQEALKKLKP